MADSMMSGPQFASVWFDVIITVSGCSMIMLGDQSRTVVAVATISILVVNGLVYCDLHLRSRRRLCRLARCGHRLCQLNYAKDQANQSMLKLAKKSGQL